jgi:hypothetical protein
MRHREAISHVASVLTGVAGILLACLVAYGSRDGSKGVLGPVVLICTLLSLGVGLALRQFWARRATAALGLVAAVLLPIGVINPFAAMDVAKPASLSEILAWLVPVVTALLLLAWLVDPPRKVQPNKSLERTREA